MKPLRLAQISDFHWTCFPRNPLWLFSKRLVGLLNWLIHRKTDFSRAPLEAFAKLLPSLAVDRVLLGGDFTSTALPQEFRAAQTFVERLGAPWIAIPGNHDHYTLYSSWSRRFYRYLSNVGKKGPFSLKKEGLEAHHLGESWWLIALDTAKPSFTSQGKFSPRLEKRLEELLAWIPEGASILLFNHYPLFQNDLATRSLLRSEALETLVTRDRRIKAYLHGHTHRHILADLQVSGYPVVLDGGCSAFAKGASWNLLTLDESGLLVEVYRWQDRWTVERTERIAWIR